MERKKKEIEKKKLLKLQANVRKHGKDTGVTDIKPTVVWLKKIGLPALADLISDGKN